jgi:hypothetical protein
MMRPRGGAGQSVPLSMALYLRMHPSLDSQFSGVVAVTLQVPEENTGRRHVGSKWLVLIEMARPVTVFEG